MRKIYLPLIATQLLTTGCSQFNTQKYTVHDYVQKSPVVPELRHQGILSVQSSVKNFRSDRANLDGAIDINQFKDEMLQYINELRAQGTPCSAPNSKPLTWNKTLEQAASAHVKDMALNNFFSHDGSGTSLDVAKPSPGIGSRFYERISYFGYPVKLNILLGETLGMTKTNITKSKLLYPNFKRSMEKLIKDSRHCKIITNPRFDYIGIGVYKALNRYYFVYDFAQKAQ